MRLIDADALVEHIKDLPTWWADGGGFYPGSMKYPEGMYDPEDIISSIENAPTIEAVPVVHGEWIKEMGAFFPRYICSACREKYGAEWYRHCPSCGAKMKGGAE